MSEELVQGSGMSNLEIDAIGEVMNISMGSSATAVSSLLDRQVNISTPVVEMREFHSLDYTAMEPAVLVKIEYVEGISGNNVMIFRQRDMQIILNLLMGNDDEPSDDFEFDELSMSAACEVMNQMMGAAATALSEFLDRVVNISTPIASVVTSMDSYREAMGVQEGDEIVAVSFHIDIQDVMDSDFVSVMECGLVKEIVNSVMGGSPTPAAVPAAAEPEIAPATLAAPVSTPNAAMPATPSAAPATPTSPAMSAASTMPAAPGQAAPAAVPNMPQVPPMPPMPQQPAAQMPDMQAAQAQAGMMGAGMPNDPAMQHPGGYPGMPPYGQMPAYGYPPMYPMYPPYGMSPDQMAPINVQNTQFPQFTVQPGVPAANTNMDLLMGVSLDVSVEIGQAKRKIKDIIDFGQGTVIELNKQAGAPVDIIVNGKLLARGDVVVIDDNFGVRITEIVGTKELMESLKDGVE